MKSSEWVGNTISIGLFALLAAASWGLNQYLQRARPASGVAAKPGPNAVIDNPRIIRTTSTGQTQYRLDGSRITHNESLDESVIEKPVMVSLLDGRPKTVIRAQQATATEHQNRVELRGDVAIDREAFDNQPAARITTPKATLLIQEEQAFTDAPVRIERGLSTLQGIGMRFDQKTQKIEIVSESRMVVPVEKKK